MAKTETRAYLITVFPARAVSEDIKRLGELANDVIKALTDCCSRTPQLVHPDKNKLVMLAEGEHAAIVKALQAACPHNDDYWLLAAVGTPCAASGLSSSVAWIQARSADH